jgi:hypothetical protein
MGEHDFYKIEVMEGIKKKTYDFWVERCCKQNRDMDYWLNTEKTLFIQIEK